MRRAGTALLLTLLAGCSSGRPDAAPSPTPSHSTASAAPTTLPPVTVSPTASPLTDLADGTQYVYLRGLDPARHTVVVDVVQFLTGPQYENDYTIKNENPRLRTLTYPNAVPIVVNTLTSEETGDATEDTPITLARLKQFMDRGEAQHRLFVLTLDGGRVVRFQEQYLP